MVQAIAIYRVSTSRQVESGNGLSAQRDSISQFASQNGFKIVSEFTDEGISGSAPIHRRKGLLDALNSLKEGMVLLVHKMDRLSRDTLLSLMIEKEVQRKGCRIVSASGEGNGDTVQDQLMRSILSAFSQYEKNLISLRTKQALAAKRKRGFRTGTVPYGFSADSEGKLSENPSEQSVLQLVRHLRGEGFTWISIAHSLNEKGLTNRKGNNWNKIKVYRTFSNKV